MPNLISSLYFIAGAVFSASALMLTLIILARAIFGLHAWITAKHINSLCWIVLVSGTVVGYAYCMEAFMAFYSTSKYEGDAFLLRALYGPSAWYYWMMVLCQVVAPQLFWFKRVRNHMGVVLAVSIAVNVGMFYERYVIWVSKGNRLE